MPFQHQIVAVLPGAEAEAKTRLDNLQRVLAVGGDQNPLTGLDRTHDPKTDQDDQQPAQRRLVQLTTAGLLAHYAGPAVNLLDVQYTREVGNTEAAAPVVVDGEEILPAVPAGYLLFLETQLKQLLTGVIGRLQARDPAEAWYRDEGDPPGVYRSEPRKTLSTTRRPVAHVGVQPTPEHAAIVEWRDSDVVTGEWTWVRYSGQLSMAEIYAIRDRASKLLAAVRAAREDANRIEVRNMHAGREILGFVFGPLVG
jgi:hypothetical protein